MPYVWNAWIGQKIARCESEDGATVIVLEDGRGIKFWEKENRRPLAFLLNLQDINGELWPEEVTK